MTNEELAQAEEILEGWDEDEGWIADPDDVHMSFNSLVEEVKRLQSEKNGAYNERNQCVALLSKVFPAWLERHDANDKDWEDDWRNICFIQLPTGQASWHIHDDEMGVFRHLERSEGNSWDGHTTVAKYARMALVQPHQILAEVKKDYLDILKHTLTMSSNYARKQRQRAEVAERARDILADEMVEYQMKHNDNACETGAEAASIATDLAAAELAKEAK